MFIEMIDLLRCVNDHQDTWLVASFKSVSNRFVDEATLGCPVCSAKYEIKNGIADFSLGESLPSCEEERASTSHRREELATRAGAYLDATQPGATIVLGGLWAYAGQDLADMTEMRVLALNAPSTVVESERVGLIRVASRVPLASGSVHGVAVDAWFPVGVVEPAFRVVRPGGRLVGPASFESPAGSVILAHDDRYWVAEKSPETIPLQRAKAR